MTFGEALDNALKARLPVARKGNSWFISLTEDNKGIYIGDDEGEIWLWSPDIEDLLAEDWEVR
jgi:hypothetical protein